MAEKKEGKTASALSAHPQPPQQQPEKHPQPPSKNVKYAFAALVIIIIAGAAYFYLLQPPAEKEIPLAEFRGSLNLTQRAAVVQDLRGMPPGDAQARSALQNCGVQLSYGLSTLGKNVTNYALEGESCTAVAGSEIRTKTVAECLSDISSEGRLMFAISYNSTANKTSLFSGRALFSGDAGFLSDCAITTIIR